MPPRTCILVEVLILLPGRVKVCAAEAVVEAVGDGDGLREVVPPKMRGCFGG